MARKTIGAAAAEVGVSPVTLRIYEVRGAISPERDSTGRRLYSDEDIRAARLFREQLRQQRRSTLAAS